MDNLQYLMLMVNVTGNPVIASFKPYYKWIIFNIIHIKFQEVSFTSFKPYYKWIIFNIYEEIFGDACKV